MDGGKAQGAAEKPCRKSPVITVDRRANRADNGSVTFRTTGGSPMTANRPSNEPDRGIVLSAEEFERLAAMLAADSEAR